MGRRLESDNHDFRCPIYRAVIGQASCFDLRMLSSTDVPVRLLNQLIVWIRVQANMIHSIIAKIFSLQTCSK